MIGLILAIALVLALLVALLCVLGSKDRYAEMTEEEFEDEVRKKSYLGAVITGLEGTLRKHEATILMEAKGRVERDATPSPGDGPEGEDEGSPKSPTI